MIYRSYTIKLSRFVLYSVCRRIIIDMVFMKYFEIDLKNFICTQAYSWYLDMVLCGET